MATDEFSWVRQYYGVPAAAGVAVTFDSEPGVITGTSGPHLLIRLDGSDGSVPVHPTWRMRYAPDYDVIDPKDYT